MWKFLSRFIGLSVAFILTISAAVASDPLIGSEWGFSEDDRFVRFEGEGRLAGHGGCNRFFGSYKASSAKWLEVGPLGATKKACAETIMKSESEFFQNLTNAASFDRLETRLTLYDDAGKILIELRQRDWD